MHKLKCLNPRANFKIMLKLIYVIKFPFTERESNLYGTIIQQNNKNNLIPHYELFTINVKHNLHM